MLNTSFTDIHVHGVFRYLFGACGEISLPLAARFCRVCATLHIHISTWISLCVPNKFLHVKRMRNLKKKRKKSNSKSLSNMANIVFNFDGCWRIKMNIVGQVLTYYVKMSTGVFNSSSMYVFQVSNFYLYCMLPITFMISMQIVNIHN